MKFIANELSDVQVNIHLVFKDRLPASIYGVELKEHWGGKGAVNWLFGRNGEPHQMIVGLGEQGKLTTETIRSAAGVAGRAAEKEKLANASIQFDALNEPAVQEKVESAAAVTAWVEGWLLGTYAYTKYKSEKTERHVQTAQLSGFAADVDWEEAVRQGEIRAGGTALARDLGNESPHELRPLDLAKRASDHFSSKGVQVQIYQGEQLENMQMNGIIAVGKGSKNPPALVELRHCTDPSKPLIALVGKGITFDTGGISLKSGRDLSGMRIDMGGAAAVLGALDIIVESGIPANVVVLVATAENMPDGGSMLPGEVIRYANNVSVQVKNTDAEGRLVLADALIHAHRLGAVQAVNIATLTGACASALGNEMAGVWGHDEMTKALQDLGRVNGDKSWTMPLEDEYEDMLKSHYADVSNISTGPYAGAITAALFLRRFVDPAMQWAHIDMAGTMESDSAKGYIAAGATGYGARLLADFVARRSE